MQTIKIFLASSSELKEHRKEFREFISVKNDRLHQKGIYLQIIQWEYFLDAVSETRLQEEYNKALKECDVALCMFYSKAGKYTQEEFEVAYKKFKETGKPYIYTYFFNGQVDMQNINVEDLVELNNFKKRIGELGHFFTLYKSIEDLKYQFSEQLDKLFDKWEVELVNKPTKEISTPIKPTTEIDAPVNNNKMSYEGLKGKIDEGQTGIREVLEFLTDLVSKTPELKSSLAEFNMLKRRATFAKNDEDWFNLGENLKVFMLKGEVKKRLA